MDRTRPLSIGMVVTYDLGEPGGGVKQHAMQLAAALRSGGDRVTLLGPTSRPIDETDARGFAGVVGVSSNGSDNRLGILVSPWAIWRFLKKSRFDVIHIHEPLPPAFPYYAAWLSPGVPKVATFHAYAEASPAGLLAARRVFSPLILPLIRRGIAVSEPALRHARIDWEGPLSIIPNGITTASFPPGAHGSARSRLRLLFVGNTKDERKGFGYLLEAVRQTRVHGLEIELHVVGQSSPGASSSLPPYVVHHGPLSEKDLATEYRRCDLFVAPSTGQESFGIVLLEAMSAARPILCSDIEGYRQSANPEGTCWAAPGDVEALQSSIVELAARPDERRRLGESNRRYVAQFDWTRIAPRIRREYLLALGVEAGSRDRRLASPAERLSDA
jgi:phosphatidyl-myo-inositol alpha-mannosyltransferase